MVKITTDSTADLGPYFEQFGVDSLPLAVSLGEKTFYDNVTVFPSDIYAHVDKTGILPKTAARSVEDFKDFFKTFLDRGDEVVHIDISHKMSVTNENARKAAEELGGVYVVDSLSLSTGTGLLVLYACDLAAAGLPAKEIAEKTAARAPFVQASFVVDTMQYLKKGGRCSGIVSLAATVLRIKPTILVRDGEMIVGRKYMGSFDKIITKYVENILSDFPNPDDTRVFITHSSASDFAVEAVHKKLEEIAHFKDILVTVAGSTITSHCGKGTLGVLYINDGRH